jgi:hypothetical protein
MEIAPIFSGIAPADHEFGIALRSEIPLVIELQSGFVNLANFPKGSLRALGMEGGRR